MLFLLSQMQNRNQGLGSRHMSWTLQQRVVRHISPETRANTERQRRQNDQSMGHVQANMSVYVQTRTRPVLGHQRASHSELIRSWPRQRNDYFQVGT
jgi:hypothetical protein